jgi:hypothetical protein
MFEACLLEDLRLWRLAINKLIDDRITYCQQE